MSQQLYTSTERLCGTRTTYNGRRPRPNDTWGGTRRCNELGKRPVAHEVVVRSGTASWAPGGTTICILISLVIIQTT